MPRGKKGGSGAGGGGAASTAAAGGSGDSVARPEAMLSMKDDEEVGRDCPNWLGLYSEQGAGDLLIGKPYGSFVVWRKDMDMFAISYRSEVDKARVTADVRRLHTPEGARFRADKNPKGELYPTLAEFVKSRKYLDFGTQPVEVDEKTREATVKQVVAETTMSATVLRKRLHRLDAERAELEARRLDRLSTLEGEGSQSGGVLGTLRRVSGRALRLLAPLGCAIVMLAVFWQLRSHVFTIGAQFAPLAAPQEEALHTKAFAHVGAQVLRAKEMSTDGVLGESLLSQLADWIPQETAAATHNHLDVSPEATASSPQAGAVDDARSTGDSELFAEDEEFSAQEPAPADLEAVDTEEASEVNSSNDAACAVTVRTFADRLRQARLSLQEEFEEGPLPAAQQPFFLGIIASWVFIVLAFGGTQISTVDRANRTRNEDEALARGELPMDPDASKWHGAWGTKRFLAVMMFGVAGAFASFYMWGHLIAAASEVSTQLSGAASRGSVAEQYLVKLPGACQEEVRLFATAEQNVPSVLRLDLLPSLPSREKLLARMNRTTTDGGDGGDGSVAGADLDPLELLLDVPVLGSFAELQLRMLAALPRRVRIPKWHDAPALIMYVVLCFIIGAIVCLVAWQWYLEYTANQRLARAKKRLEVIKKRQQAAKKQKAQ